MISDKLSFSFIRYSINPDAQFIPDVKGIDWHSLFKFACEQAIAGVVFEGLKLLGKRNVKPPLVFLMEWIGLAEHIERQNKILNKRSVEVIKEYREAGYNCCVLKGQGNAIMYPNPLSRSPGDIDLWVVSKLRISNGKLIINNTVNKEKIIKYVKEKHPENMEVRYYHIGYQAKGVEVELHYMPGIMNNPVYNHRLQKWYNKMANGGRLMEEVELPEGVGSIPVPTVEFNIVFQLSHMMHHFFDEGIGLRQMMDYYFVLKARNTDSENQGNTELGKILRYLGLWKFAGAVMYVMQEVLALEEAYMIAPVDEKRGKTLLNEILKGGNFGKYSGLTKHSKGGKFFAKTWRNIKHVREYPAEALCEPFFRTWHFFWRMSYN